MAAGPPHPRGGARRGDVRAENQRGTSAPSRRQPAAHVPDWRGRAAGRCRERQRWGAARRRAGRGPDAERGEPAARTALPATPGADPRPPVGFPWGSSKAPHPPGCPSISWGDYSVCFVFLSSFPRCVPFSRMAEAELHKERLQAIAVSPLSFYFLALLSRMGRDPPVLWGRRHSSTVATGHVFWGIKVCQGSATLRFIL